MTFELRTLHQRGRKTEGATEADRDSHGVFVWSAGLGCACLSQWKVYSAVPAGPTFTFSHLADDLIQSQGHSPEADRVKCLAQEHNVILAQPGIEPVTF